MYIRKNLAHLCYAVKYVEYCTNSVQIAHSPPTQDGYTQDGYTQDPNPRLLIGRRIFPPTPNHVSRIRITESVSEKFPSINSESQNHHLSGHHPPPNKTPLLSVPNHEKSPAEHAEPGNTKWGCNRDAQMGRVHYTGSMAS
jgi:hypothetical protein